MRAARAVNARVLRTIDQAPGTNQAVVRRLEPLEAELDESATVLALGDDLELSAQVQLYARKRGLKVGDMLIVHELRGGDWLATGVMTDEDLDAPGAGDPVYHEQPSGAVNGVNAAFTTAGPFAAGTLQVFLNGLLLVPADYAEVSSGFTLGAAPKTGSTLRVHYERA